MSPEISERRRGGGEPERCAIAECPEPSVRSLARVEVRKAFPDLPEEGRRASLCRAHYKEYKKATKQERELARIGW